MRIVIELKKEANAEVILEYFLSKTQLRTGYNANVVAIADVFADKIKDVSSKYKVIAGKEEVHAIFGASASSTFQFGWINGAIEGVLSTLGISYIAISPKKWQKEFFSGLNQIKKDGKTDTKQMSYLVVNRLYPKVDFKKTSKHKTFDDNKCDATLMARYIYLKNKK